MVMLTLGSPSKFLMAALLRVFAKVVAAEICPVQQLVKASYQTLV